MQHAKIMTLPTFQHRLWEQNGLFAVADRGMHASSCSLCMPAEVLMACLTSRTSCQYANGSGSHSNHLEFEHALVLLLFITG